MMKDMEHTKFLSAIGIGTLAVLMMTGILLSGCDRSELENLAPGSNNTGSGKPVNFSISLQGTPGYSAPEDGTPATRSGEPLLAEWVAVNSFDATRPVNKTGEADAGEKNEGPRIALMELREDTVSARPATRGVMPEGYTFRVIAFWKSPTGSYEFESVADYVSKGAAAPELTRGEMYLSVGQTYRFVAYSFNNANDMDAPLSDYAWSSTSITIPDLNNDFMTYDSGDKTIAGEDFTLPVSFRQQLCKLTVKISVTGFDSNTFTNCTGVYISKGGRDLSWVVGQDDIAANTDNSAPFSIPDNGTATVRLVPSGSPRPVTVHFGTLTVGGIIADGTEITGSQNVQLTRGRSYILTAQLKKKVGIQLSPGEITLTANGCTPQDKAELSLLKWAEGNLKSTGDGSSNDYVWTTPTDYGYYYTWMSTYTGNTSRNGIDPCTKLNPNLYGTGWRTPSKNEITKLFRCTDKQLVSNNGVMGMWYMNNPNGVFLPAAGYRYYNVGSGTSPTTNAGTFGYYWSSDAYDSSYGYGLLFNSGSTGFIINSRTNGFSVRCVKGDQQ